MAHCQVRQNYHEDCEGCVNTQINNELHASYVYQSMAWYFDRDDVAFNGIHGYLKTKSREEREHAEKLMRYQNMRGGRIVLQDIKKPDVGAWGTPLEALQSALELKKRVNQSLLDLHDLANSRDDAQMCDFLRSEYLEEQVKNMKELSDHIANMKRTGPGLGEFMFDKETFE